MSKTFKLYGGQPTAEVEATASIDNSYSDTQAKITVTAKGRLPYSGAYVYSSGVVVKATCNGSAKDRVTLFGNLKSYFYASNGWAAKTFEFIVDKAAAAKSVAWKVEFYSYVDGTQLGTGPAATISGTKNVSAITLYTPNAPTGLSYVRDSDSKNTVSWTAPATSKTKPVTRIYIERSTNGGAWVVLGYVAADATSYSDATTKVNSIYRYRIRAYNSAGYSGYATSTKYLYNTPAAPTSVVASRVDETQVRLDITHAAVFASDTQVQRSTDKATWEDLSPIEDKSTYYIDNPGGGVFYYRVRVVITENDTTLYSAWSAVSNEVVTICPPNAPTLVWPNNNVANAASTESFTVIWRDNPVDGSALTAAQIQITVRNENGVAQLDVIEVTPEDMYISSGREHVYVLWDPGFIASGTTAYVKVRTKHAHEDYGEWCGSKYEVYKSPPVINFEEPAEGLVENTPIHVKMAYDDPVGSFASSEFRIIYSSTEPNAEDCEGDWETLYERKITSADDLEFDITAGEFLPANNTQYRLWTKVWSTSGVCEWYWADFFVDFVEPSPGELVIEPDPETGYVVITAYETTDAELEPIVSMSLYRVLNGTRTLLGENLTSGAAMIDKEAPLNTDYSYEVVSFADSGAFNTVEFATVLNTGYFFFYWDEQIARAKWDPKETIKLSNPSKQRVYYLDRPDPVSYNGKNREDSRTTSGVVETRDDARQFQRLNDDGGRCLYKSLEGDVLYCDAEVNLNPALAIPSYWGEVSVALVKIDNTGTSNVTPIPNQLSAEQSVIFKKYLAANLEEILEELLRYES